MNPLLPILVILLPAFSAHATKGPGDKDASCSKRIVMARIGPVMLGTSLQIQAVTKLIAKAAPTTLPVIITGETGTGKELVARALHIQSGRTGELISVNVGAIPETLAESFLFGAEKGSYTGAIKQQKGVFEQADGGTVFLDEMGELPLDLQAKLLRVLDGNGFNRVGSTETIFPKVRVICATHRDLQLEVVARRFREDLFFRLASLQINLAPLRERRSDIPVLAEHFLETFNRGRGKEGGSFSAETMAKLVAHSWPGNIRQLKSAVERAALFSDTLEIGVEALEFGDSRLTADFPGGLVARLSTGLETSNLDLLNQAAEDLLAERIRLALRQTENNQAETARLLGFSLVTLRSYIKRLGIETR